MSPAVLVCFALRQEAAPFQRFSRGRSDVRLLLTGMGARNAERTVSEALHNISPRVVFSSGFAGALNPDLRIGDVLFDGLSTKDDWAGPLRSQGARPAKFVCEPRIMVTAEQKLALRNRTGGDAVEMESKVIAAACAARGIECVTLRAISDTAGEDLPLDFNALMTHDERLSPMRLAWAVAKAPNKIPALIRLGRNSTLAGEQLARVLSAVLEPVPAPDSRSATFSRST